jgi:hypothetical protein
MTSIGTAPPSAALDPDALSELRWGFREQVIEPGDAQYDEARGVFNGMFNRRPAVILRPTGTLDPWISPGMALNFYTEVGDDEITDSFGGRLDRLRLLKRQYDPGNLFRLNQNIKPA